LKSVFDSLVQEGIICHFGKWQVDGSPDIILIDSSTLTQGINEWKKFWWESFQIDSIGSGWDFEEPMIWSTAAGRVIERIKENLPDEKIVGHFHEWLSGFGM